MFPLRQDGDEVAKSRALCLRPSVWMQIVAGKCPESVADMTEPKKLSNAALVEEYEFIRNFIKGRVTPRYADIGDHFEKLMVHILAMTAERQSEREAVTQACDNLIDVAQEQITRLEADKEALAQDIIRQGDAVARFEDKQGKRIKELEAALRDIWATRPWLPAMNTLALEMADIAREALGLDEKAYWEKPESEPGDMA